MEYHAFSLDEHQSLEAALEDMPLVLNCAEPFLHTYKQMVDACLRTRTDYLDITGEIAVF